jgi:hypothetical protein
LIIQRELTSQVFQLWQDYSLQLAADFAHMDYLFDFGSDLLYLYVISYMADDWVHHMSHNN